MANPVPNASRTNEYRILSLSGGGTRGIFQAALLARLEHDRGEPLRETFDMIAATSTGGLIGLGLAAGKTAESIDAAYRSHSKKVFTPRPLWPLRPGARYSRDRLRQFVETMLGTDRMADLGVEVLICASGVDNFQGRLFTRFDRDLLLVDVAMATTAAPTYFPPVVPRPQASGYVDGGLWANDPSHVAASYAIHTLGVAPESIKLISLGSGRVTRGQYARAIDGRRVVSLNTLRYLRDISADLQAWNSAQCCKQLVGRHKVLRINPELPRLIKLDDAKTALDVLPGLADTIYDQERGEIDAWFAAPVPDATETTIPEALVRGLRAGGITRFFPSRRHYGVFGEGRESITAYVQLADRSLSMVSINLATGVDMEQIVNAFRAMICDRPRPVKIRVSLLHPERSAPVAPVLGVRADQLAIRINDALDYLSSFGASLPTSLRTYFSLSRHSVLPAASAIMIDETSSDGLIQLETKPYASAFASSFAWEIGHGTDFFETVRDSYARLVDDGINEHGILVGDPWQPIRSEVE